MKYFKANHTLKNVIIFCLFFSFISPEDAQSQNIPFDQETFEAWIDMRVGNGEKPVFWYCYGEVYTYPEGELVARMQGVDMAILLPVAKDSVIQLNRKIFLYLDKETGEVLTELNGIPVKHIKYPYQMINYILEDGKLKTWVTQGSGKRVNKIGPGYNTNARRVGDTYFFGSPIFLNFETPRGKYEAAENYDFIVNTKAEDLASKYQLMWWRYGDLAPHFGKTKGTIQLVSYRIENFEDIPNPLRDYIKEEAQMWTQPPRNLAEIKSLQAEQ